MTQKVSIKFSMVCNMDTEDIPEMGELLALFIQESFFNGEDVLEFSYTGHEVLS